MANPNLTWETMRSLNAGLDLSLFNNRIRFTADAYQTNNDGLLLNVNIPAVAGFTQTLQNVGEVRNRGLELALNTTNLKEGGAFRWNTAFNISFNRNEVLSLGGSGTDFLGEAQGPNRTVVGQPMWQFFGRITDGIFNSQAEIDAHVPQDNNPRPGDRRFRDLDGDGLVNNNDRTFTGNPFPDFTYGFTNNMSFKNFELNFVVNGSYGNDILLISNLAATNLNGNLNQDGRVRNRWRSAENPGDGNTPKALFGFNTMPDVFSDYYIFDGSFLRLTNVTLAYSLPSALANRARFQSARVYVSGQNLLTLTRYPGFDPETGGSLSNPIGADLNLYPMARVLTLGLNLTL
jgi:hypothetical protein